MKKKILILILLIGLAFSYAHFAIATEGSDTINSSLEGLKETASYVEGDPYKTRSASTDDAELFITTELGRIIGVALSFVGVIFLILIIFGGFTWMMAGGNEDKVKKAKNLIGSAVIGLVIIFAAYAITAFIGQALTNNQGMTKLNSK